MEGPGEKPGVSYLETPRLPFPSSFEAAAATVNNSPENCLGLVRNEGWHPEGSGSWRIGGGRVTAANYREETNEGAGGPLARGYVLDAGKGIWVIAGFLETAVGEMIGLDGRYELALLSREHWALDLGRLTLE